MIPSIPANCQHEKVYSPDQQNRNGIIRSWKCYKCGAFGSDFISHHEKILQEYINNEYIVKHTR